MTGTRKSGTAAVKTPSTAPRSRRRRKLPIQSTPLEESSCHSDSNHESTCIVGSNSKNCSREYEKQELDKENLDVYINSPRNISRDRSEKNTIKAASPPTPSCVDGNQGEREDLAAAVAVPKPYEELSTERSNRHSAALQGKVTKNYATVFTTTLQQDNQSIATPPIESKKLCSAVTQASSSFPSISSSGAILLEEKKCDIVNIARRCIRSATSTAAHGSGSGSSTSTSTTLSIPNMEQSLTLLKVSIHCLRAVSPILLSEQACEKNEQQRVAMVIKLLYHAIATVEGIQKEFCKQYLSKAEQKEGNIFLDSSLVCFHGYHVLGLLLSNAMDGRVVSTTTSVCQNQKVTRTLFPVPSLEKDGMVGFEEFGDLSLEQIIKIATQSNVSLSNIMIGINKVFAKKCIGTKEVDQINCQVFDMLHCAMQSVLGGEVEEYDQCGNEDGIDALSSCLRSYKNLISRIAMPWILLPIAIDGSGVDTEKIQSALAMASKVSKGLLEIASFLEKACVNCNEENIVSELLQHSLCLQQESIFISLVQWKNARGCWSDLNNEVLNSTHYSSAICKSFGKICMSAVRASVTYSRTRNMDATFLTKFHCEVGKIIDRTVHCYIPASALSEYAEYAVCRSLHFANDKKNIELWRRKNDCKSSKCIFATFPFPFRHRSKSCRDKDALLTVMAAFYLGLSAKYLIQLESISKSIVDSVIDSFRDRVIKSDCTRGLMMAFQTMSKLQLQSLAIDQMKFMDKKASGENWNSMYITARILGECSGPMNFAMMKLVKKEKEKYYSLALDCYLRAANLQDGLNCQIHDASMGQESCLHDSLQESDRLIERCRELSLQIPGKNCLAIVDSVAKSISNIAKRRMTKQQTKESLFPFFVSLEIFVAIKDKSLPSRFLQVSTVLQSEGMLKEAFVVLCSSISQLAKHSCKKGDVGYLTLDNVLLFCDDYINGTMTSATFVQSDALPEVMAQALSRIGRLLISIIRDREQNISLDKSFQTPLADNIRCCANQSPLDNLRYFIQTAIAPEDNASCSRDEADFRMAMALDFLQSFGGNLAEVMRREEIDLNLSDLVEFFRAFIEEVKVSFHGMEVVDGGFIASLSIVGAASTRSIGKHSNVAVYDTYYQFFVDIAVKELKDTLHLELSDERTAQIMIARTSVVLLSDYEDNYIVGLCKDALDMAARSKSSWSQSGLRNYNNALLLNLFKVLQTLECSGSSIVAAEYISLLENTEDLGMQDDVQLLISIITPLLARGELYPLAKRGEAFINERPERSKNHLINRVENLFERVHGEATTNLENGVEKIKGLTELVVELHTTSAAIHSLMITEDNDFLRNAVDTISDSLNRWEIYYLESSNSAHLPKCLLLPVAWWSSSCLLALFYGNIRIGDVSRAWLCIRLCCDITQNALATSKILRKQLSVSSVYSDKFLVSYLSSRAYDKMFKSRRCQSLELIAKAYASAGDSRRAKRYIIAAAESLDMIPPRTSLPQKSALYELTTLMKCQNSVSLGVRTTMNDIFSLSMTTSTFDREVVNMVKALSGEDGLASCPFVQDNFLKKSDLDWNREALKYALSMWKKSTVLEDCEAVLGMNFLDNIISRVKILSNFTDLGWPDISAPPTSSDTIRALGHFHNTLLKSDSSFSSTVCDAVLTFVKKVLFSNVSGIKRNDVLEMLSIISEKSLTSSECRAEALYLLAIEYLEKARQSGELKLLWSGTSMVDESVHTVETGNPIPHLLRARSHLSRAITFIGPASSHLSRNILRTLALVTGPEDLNTESSISAGEIVHSSVGSSARQAVARGFGSANVQENDLRTIFEAFDHPFSKQDDRNKMLETMYRLGCKYLPSTWKFVAIALCPTGEVLISLLQPSLGEQDSRYFSYQTQCVFPQQSNKPHDVSEFEQSVLQPFDEIMEKSRKQLSGIDIGVATNNYNNSKEKKQAWWDERYNLDENLCHILKNIDERYFQTCCLEDLISICDNSGDDSFCVGNLSARFEAVCNIDKNNTGTREDTVPSKEELGKLTVVKLKERLIELGCSQKEFRSTRKAGLIELLQTLLAETQSDSLSPAKVPPNTHSHTESKQAAGENCIFLILDEQLQRLPLEGVLSLRDKTVCRLPSLPFAISSLHQRNQNKDAMISPIDLSKTKYVIDPESNLKETKERILSTLTCVSDHHEWDWEGKVGEVPSKDFMHRALKQEDGLYLYFGHGGGERFFSRVEIEELVNKASSQLDPCASIILMGCSSGVLNSVSGKQMYFEPDGTALSYLCAGAPCVVGTLWDVTDRDIDRFSVSLLEGIYQADEITNLAKCTMSSRDACKLRYIVGCAPVIYGIPVSILNCSK